MPFLLNVKLSSISHLPHGLGGRKKEATIYVKFPSCSKPINFHPRIDTDICWLEQSNDHYIIITLSCLVMNRRFIASALPSTIIRLKESFIFTITILVVPLILAQEHSERK